MTKRRPPTEGKCPCGTKFRPRHGQHRHCSDACRLRYVASEKEQLRLILATGLPDDEGGMITLLSSAAGTAEDAHGGGRLLRRELHKRLRARYARRDT